MTESTRYFDTATGDEVTQDVQPIPEGVIVSSNSSESSDHYGSPGYDTGETYPGPDGERIPIWRAVVTAEEWFGGDE